MGLKLNKKAILTKGGSECVYWYRKPPHINRISQMKLQHACYHKYSSQIKHVDERETSREESKIKHNIRARSMTWEAGSS